MTTSQDRTVPCPYRAICSNCPGDAWTDFRVVLNSGEEYELNDVREVIVAGDTLTVSLAKGPPRSFPLSSVYYAGCGHSLPSMPS